MSMKWARKQGVRGREKLKKLKENLKNIRKI